MPESTPKRSGSSTRMRGGRPISSSLREAAARSPRCRSCPPLPSMRARGSTTRKWNGSTAGSPFLDEFQGGGVHAVAKAGRFRTVGKNVTQVRVAAGADDLGPPAEEAVVLLHPDVLLRDGGPEAWPSRSGIVFRVGTVEVVPAADALVDPFLVGVPVRSGERPLGPLFPRDVELFRCQQLLPLGIGFGQLPRHDVPGPSSRRRQVRFRSSGRRFQAVVEGAVRQDRDASGTGIYGFREAAFRATERRISRVSGSAMAAIPSGSTAGIVFSFPGGISRASGSASGRGPTRNRTSATSSFPRPRRIRSSRTCFPSWSSCAHA